MIFEELQKRLTQHRRLYSWGLVIGTLIVIASAVYMSLFTALGVAIGLLLLGFAFVHPSVVLGFLALYFPFEPFLLKFIPDELFFAARFFPEILLYTLITVVIVGFVIKRKQRPKTPIDLPFLLFLITIVGSIVLNLLSPTVAVIGTRQILRFMLVFFLVVYMHPTRKYMRNMTALMFVIVVIESVLGISQAIIGERLDSLLFPSEARFLGEITLAPNSFRFWDPGSRVFGTMGRYDRLGTFLGFFLLIAAGLLYEVKTLKVRKERWIIFVLGLPALALTFSRSGWFGFALGFLLIGWYFKKDKIVKRALTLFIVIAVGYAAISGLSVRYLVDVPSQGITERFFEAFSYERWRGEYYGTGRLYWIVNTPLHVISAAPLFGHGPGTFGGGAVSALRNTSVYDELGLPFGVAGTEGYVDNNWLSIWGETGTLGLIFYTWMLIALFLYSVRVYREAKDPFAKALALGLCGAIIAFWLNAFLASFLETRTLAFYFWMYAGFVVVLGLKEGIPLRKKIE